MEITGIAVKGDGLPGDRAATQLAGVIIFGIIGCGHAVGNGHFVIHHGLSCGRQSDLAIQSKAARAIAVINGQQDGGLFIHLAIFILAAYQFRLNFGRFCIQIDPLTADRDLTGPIVVAVIIKNAVYRLDTDGLSAGHALLHGKGAKPQYRAGLAVGIGIRNVSGIFQHHSFAVFLNIQGNGLIASLGHILVKLQIEIQLIVVTCVQTAQVGVRRPLILGHFTGLIHHAAGEIDLLQNRCLVVKGDLVLPQIQITGQLHRITGKVGQRCHVLQGTDHLDAVVHIRRFIDVLAVICRAVLGIDSDRITIALLDAIDLERFVLDTVGGSGDLNDLILSRCRGIRDACEMDHAGLQVNVVGLVSQRATIETAVLIGQLNGQGKLAHAAAVLPAGSVVCPAQRLVKLNSKPALTALYLHNGRCGIVDQRDPGILNNTRRIQHVALRYVLGNGDGFSALTFVGAQSSTLIGIGGNTHGSTVHQASTQTHFYIRVAFHMIFVPGRLRVHDPLGDPVTHLCAGDKVVPFASVIGQRLCMALIGIRPEQRSNAAAGCIHMDIAGGRQKVV